MGIKERREREKNERRESILRAAIQVYAKEGYHAITMDKIAAKAELGRATLYLYFKTKDEIFVHAIAAYAEFFGELLEGVYENRNTIKGNILESLWRSFIQFYEKDRALFNATPLFSSK